MNKITKQLLSGLVTLCWGSFVGSDIIAQNAPPQEAGWSAACLSDRVCELKSEISSSGRVAARVSVFNIRGYFFFQYTIPLGVDLTQGVFVRVDEEQNIPTEVSSCSGNGCTGTFDLTSPMIQSMKRGSNLAIHFTSPINQDTFAITFSLSGFTARFADIIDR